MTVTFTAEIAGPSRSTGEMLTSVAAAWASDAAAVAGAGMRTVAPAVATATARVLSEPIRCTDLNSYSFECRNAEPLGTWGGRSGPS